MDQDGPIDNLKIYQGLGQGGNLPLELSKESDIFPWFLCLPRIIGRTSIKELPLSPKRAIGNDSDAIHKLFGQTRLLIGL